MRILLLHLDGKLPNLALMRVAAHHRQLGDEVELRRAGNAAALEPRFGDAPWDRVYGSLIFERTRPLAQRARTVYPGIELGGTGWRVESSLADVGIDDGPVDYADYPRWRQSIGFAMRGCRLRCEFCVVPRKEGRARSASTVAEIWRGAPWPRELLLLDNDFFGNPAWRDRIAELRDRMLNDETAAAIASVNYRDDSMQRPRIYTAWG